jgi:redox-sensitive bicupin YhaK (pirin superfamily)
MTILIEAPELPVERVIIPSVRDLGDGFRARRALPSPVRRMVGPFIFLDHFGPIVFGPGAGSNIRPHPHIGLSTLSYLLQGEMIHRDSEGNVQPIRAGDLNWMTAGSGIAHSERSPPTAQVQGGTLFGQQIWVALPKALEEMPPSFSHHAAGTLRKSRPTGFRWPSSPAKHSVSDRRCRSAPTSCMSMP